MADTQQQLKQFGLEDWHAPLLPPLSRRTTFEELLLKQTHWKDLYASDQPFQWYYIPPDSDGNVFIPLRPDDGTGQVDNADLAAPPIANTESTVALSSDGQADSVFAVKEQSPLQVAQEAEKRPANVLIETKEEEKTGEEEEEEDPLEIKAKGERGSELTQRSVNYGGRSRRTPKTARRRATRESGRSFSQKYMRDAEMSAEYKLVDESGELKKIKGEAGPAEGSLRVLYGDVNVGAKGSVSRKGVEASAGASGQAGFMKAEGTLNKDGNVSGRAEGRAVYAEGEARVVGEINFKEREATLFGRLGATLALLDGEIFGEIKLTPRRARTVYINAVNDAASWFDYGEQLKHDDNDWPTWGIVLGIGVGGTVGLSGEITGDVYGSKKGIGAGGKIKAAPLVGGSVRVNGGIMFGEDE